MVMKMRYKKKPRWGMLVYWSKIKIFFSKRAQKKSTEQNENMCKNKFYKDSISNIDTQSFTQRTNLKKTNSIEKTTMMIDALSS